MTKDKPRKWACRLTKEGHMNTAQTETREQTMAKIDFHLPTLTDKELRMVAAFVAGMKKSRG